MLLSDIINQVNRLVSNSSSFKLNYNQLEHYISSAVDYVNFTLKTNMLTPQEEWDLHGCINAISTNANFKGDWYEAPEDATKGDLYYNIAEHCFYYFNGAKWCYINLDNAKYIADEPTESDNFLGVFTLEDIPEGSENAIYYNKDTKCYYQYIESNWQIIYNIKRKEYDLPLNINAINPNTFSYTSMPDNVIRTVLIYYIAASYLEEEDEFESQYKSYKERAENALVNILHTNYSMYHCNW